MVKMTSLKSENKKLSKQLREASDLLSTRDDRMKSLEAAAREYQAKIEALEKDQANEKLKLEGVQRRLDKDRAHNDTVESKLTAATTAVSLHTKTSTKLALRVRFRDLTITNLKARAAFEHNKVSEELDRVHGELAATRLQHETKTVAEHKAFEHDLSLTRMQRDEAYTKVVELVRHSRLRTMSVLRNWRKHRLFRPTVLGFHSYSSLRYQRMSYYARA
ncbi:uncharacterized protein J4E84_011077 [Alternaria hordeiaustralica]|uniref:uncharacterized protein n=1 Tax=Alternaria hordeiaustralica TaxID=1187925 RepID=UPI0020C5AE51|nr:uncharacterized protein J4E84_011077 [Alternaria hordeiaustralica]KAI4673435.1 hypothetical protein J4E84_011077 [Alternaria hordeiaustralica]